MTGAWTVAEREGVVEYLDVDAWTLEEQAGWACIARALRQWRRMGATYAAIPQRLLTVLGVPSYPLRDLAPVIDPAGDFCGLDGYYRDDLARIDWWCLLPADHGVTHPGHVPAEVAAMDPRHAWDRFVICRRYEDEPEYPPGSDGRRLRMAPPWVVVRDAVQVVGMAAEVDDFGPELHGMTLGLLGETLPVERPTSPVRISDGVA